MLKRTVFWIAVFQLLLFGKGVCLACNSPLVLDLDGDGLYTTGVDAGVLFDLDGDGTAEVCGWTDPWEDDAFLWLDLNGNGEVDGGRELFGDASELPNGAAATNGFEALAFYDQPGNGGNRDQKISPEDSIWPNLRLWIDRSHDGFSDQSEIYTLGDWQILSIHLSYRRQLQTDGNLNLRAFWGKFFYGKADSSGRTPGDIVDIFFATAEP